MPEKTTTTETVNAEPEVEQVDHGSDLASRIGYRDWETGRDEVLELAARESEGEGFDPEAEIEEETADVEEGDGGDSDEAETTDEPDDDAGDDEGSDQDDDAESEEVQEGREEGERGQEGRDEVPATHKVKVDGEEREVTTEELVRGYQLAESSQARMREAKKLEESAKFVIGKVEENPFLTWMQLARNKGLSRQDAEAKLVKMAQDHFTPIVQEKDDARKQRHEREDFEEEKRQLAAERERLEAQRVAAEQRRTQEQFENMISSAMKSAGLQTDSEEEHAALTREVAQTMLDALELGSPMRAEEAAKVVAQKRDQAIQKLASTLSPDEFARRFPQYAKKVAQQNIEAAKKRRQPRSTSSTRRAKPPSGERDLNGYFQHLHEELIAGR